MTRPSDKTTTIDLPDFWLVVLGRAVSTGDHKKAAEALEQLRRLGLEVAIRWIDNINRQGPIHVG